MATVGTLVRNHLADALSEGLNVLLIKNASGVVLVRLSISGWETPENGTLVPSILPLVGTAEASGVAATADISDGEGGPWVGAFLLGDLSVGTSNAHIVLDSVNITSGQVIQITNLSVTIPSTIESP